MWFGAVFVTRFVVLQFLQRIVLSECTGLPLNKTFLTTDKTATFPVEAGESVLVKCRDDDLILHGSLHLTCLSGVNFHFQTDPTCEPAEGHSVELIVGIVVGVILLAVCVLGGIYFYFKSGYRT
ncbi:hypothetical protein ACHWQZ_G013154 [Mnemiopsis leidyi]